MPEDSGIHDHSRITGGDDRYWSAPPWRVRVEDGNRVNWIDLKRPYVLIGSHRCCTLRIRGAHVPEVAYFVCCLRDRIEAWPTSAIAFARWGAIGPDVQVVVGPCSLTFHRLQPLGSARSSATYLANSEIETQIESPGQSFTKTFRRPVTIIGDNHPSVMRLHGRGMLDCNYAAVVQDNSFWLVDLAAKRMQRGERVRRLQLPGERLQMGDAEIEFLAAKPRQDQVDDDDDSGIGIGTEDPSTDIHSDIHSDPESGGLSAMASGIYSYGADSSSSFISSSSESSLEPPPSSGDSSSGDLSSGVDSRSNADEDNADESQRPPELCLSESSRHRSAEENGDETASGDDFDSRCHLPDDSSDSDDLQEAVTRRVDGASRKTPRPSRSEECGELTAEAEESASESALHLVDTAMDLVDAAVKESEVGAEPNDSNNLAASEPDASLEQLTEAPSTPLDPPAEEADALEAMTPHTGATSESSHDEPLNNEATAELTLSDQDPPTLIHQLGGISAQSEYETGEEAPAGVDSRETDEPLALIVDAEQDDQPSAEQTASDEANAEREEPLIGGTEEHPDGGISSSSEIEESKAVDVVPATASDAPLANMTSSSQEPASDASSERPLDHGIVTGVSPVDADATILQDQLFSNFDAGSLFEATTTSPWPEKEAQQETITDSEPEAASQEADEETNGDGEAFWLPSSDDQLAEDANQPTSAAESLGEDAVLDSPESTIALETEAADSDASHQINATDALQAKTESINEISDEPLSDATPISSLSEDVDLDQTAADEASSAASELVEADANWIDVQPASEERAVDPDEDGNRESGPESECVEQEAAESECAEEDSEPHGELADESLAIDSGELAPVEEPDQVENDTASDQDVASASSLDEPSHEPLSDSIGADSEIEAEEFEERASAFEAPTPSPVDEPDPVSLAEAVALAEETFAVPEVKPQPKRAIDAEALTSHVTMRLSEIGKTRTMTQQILRWVAVTIGVIVPLTVLVWVVQRIYSEWY